ncbi:hypothetical protein ACI8B_50300 [Acinetobacter proteolyticus]|uniref:Uncharacterized protein n=1 Tax=Acinetobacter proteolyticus TaxID=1776741 RepID=A0A653KCP1_9GAMM|nr:hypothetical protein ACI8B_50300 [Acinetobacter proteolyticus]
MCLTGLLQAMIMQLSKLSVNIFVDWCMLKFLNSVLSFQMKDICQDCMKKTKIYGICMYLYFNQFRACALDSRLKSYSIA